MKTKILGLTLIVTLVAVAAFNINLSKTESNFDFTLANVDALASEAPIPIDLSCYKTVSSAGTKAIISVIYCGDCKPIQCRSYSSPGYCTYYL